MLNIIVEGKAKVKVPVGQKISKELPVFYNPVMKFNRDVSVLLLAALKRKGMVVADPLAASGVRSIRFMNELPKGTIRSIILNDGSAKAYKSIVSNLQLNKLHAKVLNMEANNFLLMNKPFDYIDIDPFGSPNPFLDAALKSVARDGILAVTATDTGALAGAFMDAGRRKYWAEPLKNEFMHETGLRILIRRVQLAAASNDKAAMPIVCYFKDHYYRAFFMIVDGAKEADKLLAQHKYLLYCRKCFARKVSGSNSGKCHGDMEYGGPLFVGKLGDEKVLATMIKICSDDKVKKFLGLLHGECNHNIVGFYDIHKVCKVYKLAIPRKEKLLRLGMIESHIVGTGLKSSKEIPEFVKIVRKM